MDRVRRERLLIIYLCFFLSGLAGLIYEILWNKYLALFIGSTGRAHVMTLAVFMGGLALGSAIFGRRADRIARPLLLYILLELGIGLWGIAYPFLFEPYRAGFIALARVLGLKSSWLMAGKLVFCALSILVPTFLMGGTLPVLGRYLVGRMADLGPRVATLYYLNTFGAFFGCMLAGFLMIPTYGLPGSMMIAAGLNFTVCVVASLLLRRKYVAVSDQRSAVSDRPSAVSEQPSAISGQRSAISGQSPAIGEEQEVLYALPMRRIVLWTIGLSGFAAMVYEIAWIRLLTLVLGASTYSFTLMVGTFIFGIGTGSFLLSFKRRQTGYDAIYGYAELGIGLSVLAVLPAVEWVPYWFNHLVTLFVRAPFAFGPYMFMQLLICFLLMLAPTVLLGMTLPAASRIVTEAVSRVGSRVGTVYAINTIGTLLGAGMAGLVFLPTIGLKRTFELGIVINLVIGLIVVWGLAGRPAHAVRLALSAACIAIFAAYLIGVPQWDQDILSSGVYRQHGRFHSFQGMLDMLAKRDTKEPLYYKDGVDASIAVVESERTRSLLINGKADASDTGDMSTQILISHYPLLTRPNAKKVLVIGLGSGVSAGSALQYPIEQMDVVEISKEVVEAATTHFADANSHYHRDPRVTTHVEDAKTFLLITPTVYDVIISEPTNPWIAGVAGLFSREFYETCRQHLPDDGLIVQWIHVYEIQDETLQSVLGTFSDAFPYYVIWNMNRFDAALMGSPRPFVPDFAWMEQQMARTEIHKDLGRLGIEHPLALLATQMYVNCETRSELFSDAIRNSDFYPYLEYKAPVGFFAASYALGIKSLDMRAWPKAGRQLWIDTYRPAQPPSSEQFAAFYKRSGMAGSLYEGKLADWTDRWLEAYPDDPRAWEAWIGAREGRFDWQREQLARAAERFPNDNRLADVHARVLVRLLEQGGQPSEALLAETRRAIGRAAAFHPKSQWPYARLLIEVAFREGRMAEVLQHGAMIFPNLALIRQEEGSEATFKLLRTIGEAALARGRRDVAEQCVREMEVITPRDLQLSRLKSALAAMGSGQGNEAP